MIRLLIEKLQTAGMAPAAAIKWSGSVINDPGPGSVRSAYPDMMLFDLRFTSVDLAAPQARRLRIWTLHSLLSNDPEYAAELVARVQNWLVASQDAYGEIWCFTR
jgi:hypothetical protein